MAYKRKYRSYRKARGKRALYRKMKRTRFQARVLKIAQKNQETKFFQSGRENLQLYHDVGAGTGPTSNQVSIAFDPWSLVAQGTTRSTRIGDKITPVGYKLRLWMANKADRVDLLYRVIIAVLPRSINGVIPNGSNIDLFRVMDGGTNNSTMCGMIDQENVKKVLHDKVYHVQNATGYDTKEVHVLKKFYIKSKRPRPIRYLNNGTTHQNNFLGVWVIPYDSYLTLQTDNVASCAYVERLYWKDA